MIPFQERPKRPAGEKKAGMGGKKKKLAPGAGGEGGGAGGGLQTIAMHDAPPNQVWSLTQFY